MAAIFLLTKVQQAQTPDQSKSLVEALTEKFPEAWYDLGNNSYLVATSKPLLTNDISKLAGISDGAAGAYLVTDLDSYFGWANRSIWEWIKVMKERDGET